MVQSKLAPVVVLVGRGGSGKTSTARILARKSPVPVIIFGGYIRAEIEHNTELGRRALAGLTSQGRVPADIYISYLERQIRASPARFKNGFLVEAFPRSIFQVPEFDRFLSSHGMKVAHVFLFNVSKRTSLRRLKTRFHRTGRTEIISPEKRQELFDAHANRLIAFYGRKGMVTVSNSNHLPVRQMTNFFLSRFTSRIHRTKRSQRSRVRARSLALRRL